MGATPALAADGTLYGMTVSYLSGSTSYRLIAVDSQSGLVKWGSSIFGLQPSPVTIGPDGTVYVIRAVNNQGLLIALKGTAPLADAPWPEATPATPARSMKARPCEFSIFPLRHRTCR